MLNHFGPDPENAADVLAFVLCPARVFLGLGGGGDGEMEALKEALLPVKKEAVRRWAEAAERRKRH